MLSVVTVFAFQPKPPGIQIACIHECNVIY